MEDNIKIMLCEDDENLGMLLREYLQAKGFSAELFPDGEAGYRAFTKQKYDICILDVMMPQLTGWEVLRYLRNSPELKNTGVLMLTGIGETLNELSSPMYGADDFIDKPFKSAEHLVKVRRILSKRCRAASPAV